jgi:hypothetical protein
LRSVGCPVAAPILSATLHASFIKPLAKRMRGSDAGAKAAVITAYVPGCAVLRTGLGSPVLEAANPDFVTAKPGGAIQDCLS